MTHVPDHAVRDYPRPGEPETLADRLARTRLARAYASLALDPQRLAGLLRGHLAPGWSPSTTYAVGPCPGGCASDSARAYAVPGWSPWVRCWSCGLDATMRELLTMRLGDLAAVEAIMQAASGDPAPNVALAYMETAHDSLEALFDRTIAIDPHAGVLTLPALVIEARVRPSGTGRPTLVLDLALPLEGRWIRAAKWVSCHLPEYGTTLSALGLSPHTEPEALPLRELPGRVCVASARSEGSPLGRRTKIVYLDPSTPDSPQAPSDELAMARWLIEIAAASRIITEPLDATIIDTVMAGEPDHSQRIELRVRVDELGWSGPEILRWRPSEAACQALLTTAGHPHGPACLLKGSSVVAMVTRGDGGRVEVLCAVPDRHRSPVGA